MVGLRSESISACSVLDRILSAQVGRVIGSNSAKEHLVGPSFQRMSAEQMWDSMVSMLRDDVDQLNNIWLPKSNSVCCLPDWTSSPDGAFAGREICRRANRIYWIKCLYCTQNKGSESAIKKRQKELPKRSPHEIKRLQRGTARFTSAQNAQMASNTMLEHPWQ